MFQAPLGPSSGAQELYRWLLPVVYGALVYRSLVWCGAVGLCVRFAGFCLTGSRITHSSTPDQRPVNQCAMYHKQQPSV